MLLSAVACGLADSSVVVVDDIVSASSACSRLSQLPGPPCSARTTHCSRPPSHAIVGRPPWSVLAIVSWLSHPRLPLPSATLDVISCDTGESPSLLPFPLSPLSSPNLSLHSLPPWIMDFDSYKPSSPPVAVSMNFGISYCCCSRFIPRWNRFLIGFVLIEVKWGFVVWCGSLL